MQNIIFSVLLFSGLTATGARAQQVKLLEIETFEEPAPAESVNAPVPEAEIVKSPEIKKPVPKTGSAKKTKSLAAGKKGAASAPGKKKTGTTAGAAAAAGKASPSPAAAAPAQEPAAAAVKPVEIVDFAPEFELQLATRAAKAAAKPVIISAPAPVAAKAPVPDVSGSAALKANAVPAAAAVKSATVPVSGAAAAASGPEGKGFLVEMRHKVNDGDTLWDLSRKYYSDPFKWGKIYNANLDLVNNPDRIYPKAELVIPDITEEVSPMQAPIAIVAPALESAEKIAEVKPVPAPPQPQAPAVKKTPAPHAEMNGFGGDTLSAEMPKDQKEWSSSIKVVPDNWEEDGVVASKAKTGFDSVPDGLSFSGETVVIRLSPRVTVKQGDHLSVYLRGAAAFSKEGKKIGRELQPVGTVEVLSADGRKVRGRVIDASTTVTKGMVVKMSVSPEL